MAFVFVDKNTTCGILSTGRRTNDSFFHVVHLLILITTSLLSRLAEGYSTERSTAVAVKTPLSKRVVKLLAFAIESVNRICPGGKLNDSWRIISR